MNFNIKGVDLSEIYHFMSSQSLSYLWILLIWHGVHYYKRFMGQADLLNKTVDALWSIKMCKLSTLLSTCKLVNQRADCSEVYDCHCFYLHLYTCSWIILFSQIQVYEHVLRPIVFYFCTINSKFTFHSSHVRRYFTMYLITYFPTLILGGTPFLTL